MRIPCELVAMENSCLLFCIHIAKIAGNFDFTTKCRFSPRQWRSQPKIFGGAKLHTLIQWCTQDSAKGGHNRGSGGLGTIRQRLRWSGDRAPAATNIWGIYKKNTHFSLVFLAKKDTRVPPSGLNLPLLALLVGLRYCISIFVCRLEVTENISGGNFPLCPTPGHVPAPVVSKLLLKRN